MKKRLNKKLVLNKTTIASLKKDEMNLIRGATLVDHCTESCSLVDICCHKIAENLLNLLLDKNQG